MTSDPQISSQQGEEFAAVAFHLADPHWQDGDLLCSTFMAALRDARRVTGRDELSGQLLETNRSESWSGALAYLILLDQVGRCFKPKLAALSNARTTIERALEYFADIGDPNHRAAIYALRNAFAHDYSILTAPSRTHPRLLHHFMLVASPVGPLVSGPQERWNGNLQTRSLRNRTVVNLRKLGEEVERVVRRLRDLHKQHLLELLLPLDEFQAVYSLRVSSLPSGDPLLPPSRGGQSEGNEPRLPRSQSRIDQATSHIRPPGSSETPGNHGKH